MPGARTDQAAERRVVAGVDPSHPSWNVLLWAQSIAWALHAAVDAVAVWDITAVMAADWVDSWDPERQAATQLSAIVAGALGAQPSVPVREGVRRGRPADQLIEASQGAQVLVLGRRHRGGLRRDGLRRDGLRRDGLRRLLRGSVSARCAAHAHCPVLIVPADAPPAAGLTGPPTAGLTGPPPARHLIPDLIPVQFR
jgi:nucleotide-binding universal stress UspA family protein